MALVDVIRNVVTIANSVTKSLQEDVQHVTWVGQDGFGAPLPPAIVTRKALVEQKLQLRKLADGRLVEVKAKLTFLDVIPPNGAAGRDEPVDPKDTFVLADGTTGPVVDVEGMRDAGAGRPFLLEVWLGA